MTIKYYMDEHVHRAITEGLRRYGVDVVTSQEDGHEGSADSDLLDRAGELKRVLFTYDRDLLQEVARRQREGIPFVGVVYIHLKLWKERGS